MRRLDQLLNRVAERGDVLGADLLIDHLERELAGEPPIVVARKRSDIMLTSQEDATRQPGPPNRRTGLAVALASFIAVLAVGAGILMWGVLGDDGSETATQSSTTQAPTTTEAVSTNVGEIAGTFAFDGTDWSYDGPSKLEAGSATFSLVNTSDVEVAVFSWFGLEGDELETELEAYPIGAEIGPYADAPPPPPSSFLWLAEAPEGESVTATVILGSGQHMIDAATLTAGGNTDNLWRIALLEVTQPEFLDAGEAVGTFTFDGFDWSYDGPSTLEAGSVTFSLVNTSDVGVAVFSWFGLGDEELETALEAYPVGTDIGPFVDAAPPPPSDFLWFGEVAEGESVLVTTVFGAGDHLIDAATLTPDGGTDNLWRVAHIVVTET